MKAKKTDDVPVIFGKKFDCSCAGATKDNGYSDYSLVSSTFVVTRNDKDELFLHFDRIYKNMKHRIKKRIKRTIYVGQITPEIFNRLPRAYWDSLLFVKGKKFLKLEDLIAQMFNRFCKISEGSYGLKLRPTGRYFRVYYYQEGVGDISVIDVDYK
jgi:hypothetical protein